MTSVTQSIDGKHLHNTCISSGYELQVELHSWQPMAWLFDTLYTCEVWFNRHYGIMTRAWTHTACMCHYRTPLQIEADQYKGNEDWKASWLFDLPVWVTLLFYFHICQWISNKDQCLGNGNHVLPRFLCRNVAIGKMVDGEVKITVSIFNSNSDPTKPHDEL